MGAVEDDDVGVQLGVAGARVPVIERGCDHAANVLGDNAARAGSGGEDPLLGVRNDVLDRGTVGGVDALAGRHSDGT